MSSQKWHSWVTGKVSRKAVSVFKKCKRWFQVCPSVVAHLYGHFNKMSKTQHDIKHIFVCFYFMQTEVTRVFSREEQEQSVVDSCGWVMQGEAGSSTQHSSLSSSFLHFSPLRLLQQLASEQKESKLSPSINKNQLITNALVPRAGQRSSINEGELHSWGVTGSTLHR